jgi:hypothetical protein
VITGIPRLKALGADSTETALDPGTLTRANNRAILCTERRGSLSASTDPAGRPESTSDISISSPGRLHGTWAGTRFAATPAVPELHSGDLEAELEGGLS